MDDFEIQDSCMADDPEQETSAPAADAEERENAENGDSKVKNRKKYVFSFLFMLILIGVTFYIIFKDNSLTQIFSLLKDVNLWYIGVGVLVMIAYLFVQGGAIGLAARCINIKLRVREMFQYSCIGFFYSGITPSTTGGQPLQFVYMARDRLSASRTTLVLFMTNITFQLAMVLVSLVAFILRVGDIMQDNGTLIIFFILGLSINFFAFLILVGVLFWESFMNKMVMGIINLLSKLHIIKHTDQTLGKVHKYMSNFKAGVELIKTHKLKFLAILGLTVVQLLLYDVVPFFVYKAFGLTGYSWLDILAVNAVLYVSVSFIPLPGAVGVSESGFSLLYRTMFGATLIVPAMLLSRFINFYTILILTGVVSVFVQLRKPYNLGDASRTIHCDAD